jgi:hypothetical protein
MRSIIFTAFLFLFAFLSLRLKRYYQRKALHTVPAAKDINAARVHPWPLVYVHSAPKRPGPMNLPKNEGWSTSEVRSGAEVTESPNLPGSSTTRT